MTLNDISNDILHAEAIRQAEEEIAKKLMESGKAGRAEIYVNHGFIPDLIARFEERGMRAICLFRPNDMDPENPFSFIRIAWDGSNLIHPNAGLCEFTDRSECIKQAYKNAQIQGNGDSSLNKAILIEAALLALLFLAALVWSELR